MSAEHLPIIDQESERFWSALGEGTFLLKYCLDCGNPHFYPRVYCPRCWGDTEWRPASGRGTVFATTTVHQMAFEPFKSRAPYNLAIVELDEGPRLLTNVVGCDPKTVTIGMKVECLPELDDDVWMPHFRPVE
jgi:uncharacterized OB-fold protein